MKIKTSKSSFWNGEFTNWDYNKEYDYATGECYTKQGVISLYIQGEKHLGTKSAASARLMHKGRIFDINTDLDNRKKRITRLGWIRMAKKWAKEIWK